MKRDRFYAFNIDSVVFRENLLKTAKRVSFCTDYDVIKEKKIQNGRKFKTKFC